MENKSSNFQQAVWLGISSFSALLLAFLSAAILSRYLNKEDYGTYKQILYLYVTLNLVFKAGLPGAFAYFLPRLSAGQGKTLVYRINRLFFLLGALFSLCLFLGAEWMAELLRNPELSVGIRLFSPFPLFTLPAMGVEGIYTALRKTQYIAIYQTVNKLLVLACIVLPVILWQGGYKSALIGWGLASFITWIIALYMKKKPFTGIQAEAVPRLYRQIFSYSMPLMLASFVGMFLHSANQFFISRYYGSEVFADFSNGFTPLPFLAIIAGPIKAVLLPVFSRASSRDDLSSALSAYNNAVVQSVVLLYPMLLFGMCFSRDLMILAFGAPYASSSVFFQISMLKSFVEVFPFMAVLLALGQSSLYLYIHMVSAVLLWVLDFILIKITAGPVSIALAYTGITFLNAGAFLYYLIVIRKLPLLDKAVLIKIVRIVVHVLPILGLLYFLSRISPLDIPALYRLAINGLLFYLLILLTAPLARVDYLSAFRLLGGRFISKKRTPINAFKS